MLIASSHNAIPVNTANVPTEAVKNDAVLRPHIPKPPATAENPSSKHSTEFSEQNKAFFENALTTEQDKIESEKESAQQSPEQTLEQESEQSKKSGKSELTTEESTEKAEKQRKDNGQELNLEQLKEVQQLKSRDNEVRAHEQAHASVGGSLAGSPNLNYTTGPDGKRYAVSGEVSIDVSKVSNDPEATIKKLEQVQRAALAPASPSSQDLKVAAQASANVSEARAQLNVQKLEESQEKAKVQSDEESPESKLEAKASNDESKQTNSRSSSVDTKTFLNPAIARRQAAQLNQKIASSGALDDINKEIRLSLTA